MNLQEELHSAVELILEYLNFDDGFSVDTLKGDLIKILMDFLENVTDPNQGKTLLTVQNAFLWHFYSIKSV